MSHAPNLRGGQASDQATSGDQAGPGSNRRTNRAKGTHEKHGGQCMQGSRPSLPEASLNNRPDAPHESAYTTTITNANTSPTQQPPSQSITVHARPASRRMRRDVRPAHVPVGRAVHALPGSMPHAALTTTLG